jgi:glycosyltransferase involved in cell wall biosynthesis
VSADGSDHPDIVTSDMSGCAVLSVPSAIRAYDDARSFAERLGHAGSKTHDLYGPNLAAAVEQYTVASVEASKDIVADVVHCHDWMTYAAGEAAAKMRHVPMIAHIHATEYDRTDFNPNPWIAEKEREGFLAADHIIAVSQYTKDLLIKYYGISGNKISVVHNGHDHVHSQSGSRMFIRHGTEHLPMVLFLGRLTVQKNPWQFLDMAKTIHNIRPEVQFVMAGDGGMLSKLVDRACDLGLSENMIFTGKVNTKEANKLFARADCFVMPSISEPFGLVALEAIGHGTPVVLSKQSGAAEVIDAAFKVDFWDTDKMADCVMTILREQPLAMQLKAEAPRVLQKLTWKNQAGHVHGIYRNIIS